MSDQLQEPVPQASQINLDSQPSSGDGDVVLGMQRVRIDCAYDGTWFSGWARQPNLVTVQGVLEDALELVLRAHHRVTVVPMPEYMHRRKLFTLILPPKPGRNLPGVTGWQIQLSRSNVRFLVL